MTIQERLDKMRNGYKTAEALGIDIPMPQVKPPKKEKIQRIYEDDDFIVDLFPEEPMVRVSIFKDGYFKDEVIIRKEDYID